MPGLPLNLDDLVYARSVEDNRREFKAAWNEVDKASVVRTISAFANDLLNLNGGYIVLGIETGENGEPILPPRGLDGANIDLIQKQIYGECRKITPEYQPVVFVEHYLGRRIIIIWAPGGDNRPYQAPSRDAKGRSYHVRVGSQTVEARDDLLRQLLERTAKIPFDDRRNLSATLENLSPTLVRRFLADVRSDLVTSGATYSDLAIYRLLRLTAKVNSHDIPRNFALLFFTDRPDEFFGCARIEIVQFADGAGGDLLEERVIHGPINQQIRQTLDYLNSMTDVLVRKIPGQAEVDRTVAYPYEAMEEALVNAYYHRSYEDSSEPVKTYLYPDRMEIISYPGPVPGITRDTLTAGHVLPPVPARNRRIGDLLKELRLAEGRGTGVPKIRRKMHENGSPEPIFDFDDGRSYFRVTLPAHPRYRVIHALRESARMWALGESASAVANLRSAFDQQPGSGALASQLIEYAFASNDYALAKQTFDRFERQMTRTETMQPYLRYANLLLDRDRNDEAARVLDIIPTRGSTDELVNAAILHKRARDFKSAHQLFREIYESKMDDPKVLHEFAQTKIALAKEFHSRHDEANNKRLLREAVELLHRTIQLATDSVREAWCWYDLARILAWLREPKTTIERAYLRAIELVPDEVRFRNAYDDWQRRNGALQADS